MSNRRAGEQWRRDEQPFRVGTARGPEVSRRRKDHEEDYFRSRDILARHLKPVLRFLVAWVGHPWADVARAAEHQCRRSRCPRHLRGKLFAALLTRIGVAGVKVPVGPTLVVVDRESGVLLRREL